MNEEDEWGKVEARERFLQRGHCYLTGADKVPVVKCQVDKYIDSTVLDRDLLCRLAFVDKKLKTRRSNSLLFTASLE